MRVESLDNPATCECIVSKYGVPLLMPSHLSNQQRPLWSYVAPTFCDSGQTPDLTDP